MADAQAVDPTPCASDGWGFLIAGIIRLIVPKGRIVAFVIVLHVIVYGLVLAVVAWFVYRLYKSRRRR